MLPPTTGPLHLLFPLPEMLFLLYCVNSYAEELSLSHFLWEALLDFPDVLLSTLSWHIFIGMVI